MPVPILILHQNLIKNYLIAAVFTEVQISFSLTVSIYTECSIYFRRNVCVSGGGDNVCVNIFMCMCDVCLYVNVCVCV